MGIDGIRKSGPPAGSPASGETSGETSGGTIGRLSSSEETGRPFELPGTRATAAAAPVAPPGALSGPRGSLQAGAIDVEGYLDLKVHEATAHLTGLPAADLTRVRAALRERLASDPTLVDLVKSATRNVPPPADDD